MSILSGIGKVLTNISCYYYNTCIDPKETSLNVLFQNIQGDYILLWND